jgi:hypothetical protein
MLSKRICAAVLLTFTFGASPAHAGSILAYATRATAFSSSSLDATVMKLDDAGAKSLSFTTTSADEQIVIVYNAECMVLADRGTWLSVKILVDGKEASPKSGTDFALCSSVDATGAVWLGAARQSALTVANAGAHEVKVIAHLEGNDGVWRLDDTSLVVQKGVKAFATDVNDFNDASTNTIQLPIKNSGGKVLKFRTANADDKVKITYNAECNLAAPQAGKVVTARIDVPGAANPEGAHTLCHSVDTNGATWRAGTRQFVARLPTPGNQTVSVYGGLNQGPGSWSVDDSSTVVQSAPLNYGTNDGGVQANTAAEAQVPLKADGSTALSFKTTASNQVVKLSFNSSCFVAAPRSTWLGVRVTVDDIEADPAVGYEFALCTAVESGYYWYYSGLRQSVITVPAAGTHTVRVYARPSDTATWGVYDVSMTVED